MDKIKELLKNVITAIVINPEDSDNDRAKKIIWYAFFGAIVMLIVVSWIIFVVLTFNTGSVKVPNIEKDNIYAALQKLSEKKLVANVSPKYSALYSEGVVFNQSPNPGALVKKGRIVNFSVSLGDIKMALQDFRGFQLGEFYEVIKKEYPNDKYPYKIETVFYEFNDLVEKGKIIKHEPADGTPVKQVKKLKLWVSNGKKDKDYKLVPNFVGKKVGDLTSDFYNLELLYNYKYELVKNKNEDSIIISQSIGENAIIEDIIKEGKVLELTINKYYLVEGEPLNNTYLLELPKKPIPFDLDVRFVSNDKSEKSIVKIKIKGGVVLPVPYSDKIHSKLKVYINNELFKEVNLETVKK